ncbi:hypothetical protein EBBID32_45150 [Sphingobium indicum BiD32]|uniref:Uncharacterized protein n=1 Tax=Sphingobium indicum BiD32 TaxID=1301087 RepID=N1MTR2_9SPHN|nr:hypothetical protein [Sphingobium indicum]CCW20144.1 hypothetical protein EBBID32_45150 [Sphingobium indicum BiD32]
MQIEYGQLYTNASGDVREVLAVAGDVVDYLEQTGEDPQQGQCSAAEFATWTSAE